MSTNTTSAPTETADAPQRNQRGRRWLVVVLSLLLVAAVAWLAPGLFSRRLQRLAALDLQMGAIGAALEHLEWAGWLRPDDGEVDLLRAACYRRRGEQQALIQSLEAAKDKGVDSGRIQQQADLAMIKAGSLPDLNESQLVTYVEQGLPPGDVAAAFIHGFLALQQPRRAESILAAWAADSPHSADVCYMRGVQQAWLGDDEQAGIEFEQALELSPEHELARMGLAELYEKTEQWEQAIRHYDWLAGRFPKNQPARLGLARLLRKSGRTAQARGVLQGLVDDPDPVAGLAVEMAELALDAGDFAAARRWFDRADLAGAHFTDTLRAAGTAYTLSGDHPAATQQFDRADQSRIASLRSQQLQDRIAFDPSDRAAAAEYQKLATQPAADIVRPDDATAGLLPAAAQLYSLHCAACHGAEGRGDGRAARHLFPPPRNLRHDRFRLVSTQHGLPSEPDIVRVLQQGMAGTSMRAYEELTQEQLECLSRQVLQFQFDGAREQFIAILEAEDEQVDDAEADQYAARKTQAGDALPVPTFPLADAASIARGKAAYQEFTCYNCHGDDGTGMDDSPLYNDDGSRATPRDLVLDPMKGGNDPTALFYRLRIGMPGTPHPGCPTASDQQIIDMVHFCGSLGKEPKRLLTSREQAARANQRALAADFREPP